MNEAGPRVILEMLRSARSRIFAPRSGHLEEIDGSALVGSSRSLENRISELDKMDIFFK